MRKLSPFSPSFSRPPGFFPETGKFPVSGPVSVGVLAHWVGYQAITAQCEVYPVPAESHLPARVYPVVTWKRMNVFRISEGKPVVTYIHLPSQRTSR